MIENFKVSVGRDMNNFYCINLIEEDGNGQLSAQIGHFEATHALNSPWVAQTATETVQYNSLEDDISAAEALVMQHPNKANQLHLKMLYEVDDLMSNIEDGQIDLVEANIGLSAQRIAFRSHLSAQAEQISMPADVCEKLIYAATPHSL